MKHPRCIDACRGQCGARPVGTKDGYTLEFCKYCDHAYISEDISGDDLALYYAKSTKYSASSFDGDLLNQRFPGSRSDAYRYFRMIQAASRAGLDGETRPRLLEVGAGWGYASERAAQMGWKTDVIEYSKDCIASMRERLPDDSVIFQGSFEEFSLSSQCRYDALLMSQVLEHALSPNAWLEMARGLLKPGGILLVAVPQYRGFYQFLGIKDPFITPPEHLNFFTRKSLMLASREHGFDRKCVAGYSRIPYCNIRKRFQNSILAMGIYRFSQCFFFVVDRFGYSMVQIQLFKSNN